ncbi:MAG: hypothetical protein POELPBGB_01569 [Bacteroidia bacterium]|nr:hypothetical protein [Bacteroidia bacterium]
MYKKLFILFISVVISSALYAQKPKEVVFPNLPMDEKNEYITYTAVMNIQGTTAQQLYERGKKWFFSYFKNPTEKIRTDDAEKKEIEGFIRIPLMVPDKKGVETKVATIQYSLFLLFKDGRYKYTITKINEMATSYQGIEQWNHTLPQGKGANPADAEKHAQWLTIIDQEIKKTIDAMITGMEDKGLPAKEDW